MVPRLFTRICRTHSLLLPILSAIFRIGIPDRRISTMTFVLIVFFNFISLVLSNLQLNKRNQNISLNNTMDALKEQILRYHDIYAEGSKSTKRSEKIVRNYSYL